MFDWYDAAALCEDVYDTMVDYDEEYFVCPDCGELIYKVDWWGRSNWHNCPICEFDWEDGQ